MGSKTRLGSYCTKRANNGVNLVTSHKTNARLARPIVLLSVLISKIHLLSDGCFNRNIRIDICMHNRNISSLWDQKSTCNSYFPNNENNM